MKNLACLVCIISLISLVQNVTAYSSLTPICSCSTLTADDIQAFVKNPGTYTDTYSLSLELPANFSGFIQPDITLESGEKAKIETLYITPSCLAEPKNYTIKIIATSKSSGKIMTKELKLEILRCHSIALSVDNYIVACKDLVKYLQANLTNYGLENELVNLSVSVDWINLSDNLIFLEQNKSKLINLTFQPSENLTSQAVVIIAESLNSYASDEKTIQVDIKKCYSSRIDIEKKKYGCPCSTTNYPLNIKNTGLLADNYSVIFGGVEKQLELRPDQSKIINLTVPIDCDEHGVYSIDLEVRFHDIFKSTIFLAVLPKNECYSIKLVTKDKIKEVEIYKSVVYPITLKNKGKVTETYNISVSGVEWAYASPAQVELPPNQSKEIYLYVTPQYDRKDNYTITLYAESPQTKAELELVTIVTEQKLSGNISIPTGFTIAKQDWWKIIIIVFIILVVLIILVRLFVFLIK